MSDNSKFGKEIYLEWYKNILLTRKFEQKCGELYIKQKIRGFLHLYIGQEAVAAGSISATRKGDNHITAYRDHAQPLMLGTSPNALMAELYGKATGCSKGKGGSMHFFDKSVGFYGGHGIVGGQVPLGAGLAFSDKYNKTGAVTLCSMGDGAVRQGAFHEALNMAMNWKLPVIFIIENNEYAMGTAVERVSNVTDLYKLGHAYEMPSFAVDGMDCEAVHEAIESAADRARNGEGPTLLEMRTYRYKGHSMSDPQKYRSKDEVKEYQERDPLTEVLNKIKENNYASEEEIKAIDDNVKAQIEECVQFAEESPYLDASELFTDVYVGDYPYITE
ncbi:pyruvate dehydrogenase (acetyl-transferring) E1 component subunit alpha [Flavobacteriales bacterium]|jgi:pyruvate dehydrogenase E1 component alpha subunit|nr:pyruvate dehydrogenase (acetyl-transferring) E1 component subunit alpha [Flavobacteriales bacterium]